MTSRDDRPPQAYLSGETLALRTLEPADAAHPGAWRPDPFPLSTARAGKLLEQEVPAAAEARRRVLVAVRHADGALLGGLRLDESYPVTVEVAFLLPETLGPAADGVASEMLRLVVPWLSDEWAVPSVWSEWPACWPATTTAAAALGMRPGIRLREASRRDGARHDLLGWERLNPVWLARMGDPGTGIAAEEPPTPPAEVRRPAPRAWPAGGPVPPGALVVGDRLALRPLQVEDAAAIARSFLEERETFFLRGRRPLSPIALADWIGKMGEASPPPEIVLAVVTRENALVGEVNLMGIDWVQRTAETAAWVYRAAHRGGGLGGEAKHLLLEYAFDRLGLHALRSQIFDSNTRSAAAVVSQGYRRAGRHLWALDQHAGFIGWQVFDILAWEWRAARRG